VRFKLHWAPTSPYVRKVMVAAHELGLGDRFDLVRTTPENVVADVAADNPLGQIPTLVLPDGTAIYDSLVIVEYLDDLAGGALVPPAGPLRWSALTLHALGHGVIDAANRRVNELRRPAAEISARLLAMKHAEIGRALDRLDRTPLDAARVDVATIAIAVALGYLDYRFPEEAWRPGRAALADWFRRFSNRPSMRATMPAA
jgi:glutathione S-transferase